MFTVQTENAGKALRRVVKISQNPVLTTRLNNAISPEVDIGNGVLLEKGQLLGILQASETTTKLALNLFRALFQREEVVGKSLSGKKSNAHLTTSVEKEQLDPKRILAIIGILIMAVCFNTSV